MGAAVIVAGFGYRSGAGEESLRAALAAAGGRPDALAAPEDKVPPLSGLAEALGVPLRGVAPDDMHAQETATRSPVSQAARGTGSVAEACALAAAGPGARLVGPRAVSPDRMATCALAEAP